MKKTILIICLVFISSLMIQAQENEVIVKKDKKINVRVKTGEKAVVIIDGKKHDASILELLDNDKIKSISVLKGKEAMEKYDNENAIIVTSKEVYRGVKASIKDGEMILSISNATKEANFGSPVIIIDGKIVDNDVIHTILPASIYSISVLKDKESKDKYDTETGVILITTKKKAKKDKKEKKK